MTLNDFKLTHSELIMQVQCIENDMRLIYAAMKEGNFCENIDEIDTASFGTIMKELKKVDKSDGVLDLSENDYDFIDHIREMRNYWCHQCYLDFIYITDKKKKKQKFQEISDRLYQDEKLAHALHVKLECIRNLKLQEFERI